MPAKATFAAVEGKIWVRLQDRQLETPNEPHQIEIIAVASTFTVLNVMLGRR